MGFFSSNKDKKEINNDVASVNNSAEATSTSTPTPKPDPIGAPANVLPNTSNQQNITNQQTKYQNNMTIISVGTLLEGHIKVETDIQIDGTIKGTVSSKNKVILGVNGKVEGDIICQEADLSGKITGKLHIKDILVLKATASVDGDIVTGKLVMESGVKFNGKCSMNGGLQAPTPPPAPVAPQANAAASAPPKPMA